MYLDIAKEGTAGTSCPSLPGTVAAIMWFALLLAGS